MNNMANKRKYSDEMLQFLRDNAKGRHMDELAELFNAHFGTSFPVSNIHSCCKNHHITNGIDCTFKKNCKPWNSGRRWTEEEKLNMSDKQKATLFSKGQAPYAWRPIGTERWRGNRCFVKIGDPDKWILRSHYVWQQHYGEIPKKHSLLHLDGDTRNDDIENLLLVSDIELLRMNNMQYSFKDPELTKAALMEVRLRLKLNDLSPRCDRCIYYGGGTINKKYYCEHPDHKREKKYNQANRCMGYKEKEGGKE